MSSISPICSISARPAYYGTRRIAPAAATSRSKAWGARPAVEELRPARSSFPKAAFVAHVIATWAPSDVDAARAAGAYTAADGLGLDLPKVAVASL